MIKDYFSLIRVQQWYKNLVVFLAIFFSGNVFDLALLERAGIAFASLCLISSAGYIINDLIDRRKDQLHPEKKMRPLASGKISIYSALVFMGLLLVTALYLGQNVGDTFLVIAISLFLLTQLYTFYLKNVIFADVLVIASLFVLRAIAGAVAVSVVVSPWLILCPFFLALFMAIAKRKGDLQLLGERAAATRKVLHEYNHAVTDSLMSITTGLLVMSYSLYSFLSPYNRLIYTIPFSLYVIFRYYHLVGKSPEIARQPHKAIQDLALMVGILLWVMVTGALIYYP